MGDFDADGVLVDNIEYDIIVPLGIMSTVLLRWRAFYDCIRLTGYLEYYVRVYFVRACGRDVSLREL